MFVFDFVINRILPNDKESDSIPHSFGLSKRIYVTKCLSPYYVMLEMGEAICNHRYKLPYLFPILRFLLMQNNLSDLNWSLEAKGKSDIQRGTGYWIRKRSFEYRNVKNLFFLAKIFSSATQVPPRYSTCSLIHRKCRQLDICMSDHLILQSFFCLNIMDTNSSQQQTQRRTFVIAKLFNSAITPLTKDDYRTKLACADYKYRRAYISIQYHMSNFTDHSPSFVSR